MEKRKKCNEKNPKSRIVTRQLTVQRISHETIIGTKCNGKTATDMSRIFAYHEFGSSVISGRNNLSDR